MPEWSADYVVGVHGPADFESSHDFTGDPRPLLASTAVNVSVLVLSCAIETSTRRLFSSSKNLLDWGFFFAVVKVWSETA